MGSGWALMITEEMVRSALNAVIDPCSRAAGAPAGLSELGLINRIEITGTPGAQYVQIWIRVTEPGCMMGAAFVTSSRERLMQLEGLRDLQVFLSTEMDWTPRSMSTSYTARLNRHRSMRRESLGDP